MRSVSEPGMGSGAERNGHPVAVRSGLGAELPEIIRLEIGAMSDQPVGVAELALAHVVGRPRTDGFPVVIPGVELLEEVPERAVAVLEQPQFLGHLRQVGRRGASGWRRPYDTASPRCYRVHAD